MEDSSLNDLVSVRKKKIDVLREKGIDPFGHTFSTTGNIGYLISNFSEDQKCSVAGRITGLRKMGKSYFLDIYDISGKIQIYLNKNDLTDIEQVIISQLDIGDFIGVHGVYFLTKSGEKSIRVQQLEILTKSLRPLPSKWHGIQDTEICYRQRYLDIIANNDSRNIFLQRSLIISEIRRYLHALEFLEVETPMMQDTPGGAAAEPFKTYHAALGIDLYLRIAPELYLKRLLIGGFTKIFELNRNFRNEGLSRRHNPEFTMLELYWAYADFTMMASLVEKLISHLAKFLGIKDNRIIHVNAESNISQVIDITSPWKRRTYSSLIEEVVPGWFEFDLQKKQFIAKSLGIHADESTQEFEITDKIFQNCVEPKLIDPCFVINLPQELVPLARLNREDPSTVDVYELIINGQEISPGYSEMNNPILQRERLEKQAGEEKQKIDELFLEALEYGMPPAGGIGIGIDRLIMLLTGASSIRDVILFPQMRPK